MNDKTNEIVNLPTEAFIVFERRLIVGTYTDADEARKRVAARSQYGAQVKEYAALPRVELLRLALKKIADAAPTESPLKWVAEKALTADDDFTWRSA